MYLGSPAKELLTSQPATPYNSIRKRIKSVSIKYLKHRWRKSMISTFERWVFKNNTLVDACYVSIFKTKILEAQVKEVNDIKNTFERLKTTLWLMFV